MKGIFIGIILVLSVLVAACSPDIKVYKVNYKSNHPIGDFETKIWNETIFTNGQDIVEVTVSKNPEFFCYDVNQQAQCTLNLEIKISENAANNFKAAVDKYQDIMQKSGKNRTILPQRISYYLNSQKLEQEDIIKANEKLQANTLFIIQVLGKGSSREEAKENVVERRNAIVKVLIDKK